MRVHFQMGAISLLATADLCIALGDRPIMSIAKEEAQEVTEQSDCLVVSFAMLTEERFQALKISYETAIKNSIPIIFDPVGVGASTFRLGKSVELLKLGAPTVIKGNPDEIYSLDHLKLSYSGVDSIRSSKEVLCEAKDLFDKLGSVIVVTGREDFIVTEVVESININIPFLGELSGTGCMLNAVLAHFIDLERSEACKVAMLLFKSTAKNLEIHTREHFIKKFREEKENV